ncbi:hypothetical protein SPRG_20325 [Saprolegnia parasitica CBS 223.65]|uniref:Uncharacterized protein n=1 Tax=Saprolegnia parasitica (strain CBS 223.65) TaxID=695850 RepID=A0A067CDV4_SAPPC|nr:hypothetical protein SPRG_20325 [Saprolegnia parasitica CBS 223.65]KDO27360.1 hypothetical protein SPRG_20325 [Saprolegnia parasitica CBS 223.65]|eukprot:XP_012201939.1 hypothetical protein SPRG_20325 [Saprolegnia parasitica CBS 223.65]
MQRRVRGKVSHALPWPTSMALLMTRRHWTFSGTTRTGVPRCSTSNSCLRFCVTCGNIGLGSQRCAGRRRGSHRRCSPTRRCGSTSSTPSKVRKARARRHLLSRSNLVIAASTVISPAAGCDVLRTFSTTARGPPEQFQPAP